MMNPGVSREVGNTARAFIESMKAHLGEDEELLWDMATDMEPEDGCLWNHGTDDQQTVAFNDGMQYLREMLPEYKRNRSAPRS
jgi:hypothetical protein